MDRRQISLGGLIERTTLVCFDDESVFIGEGSDLKSVPFAEIVSLSKTSTALNDRYFWRLDYRIGDATERVEFRTNATLWNRNFRRFHELLSAANPAAVKTRYRWWNL